MFIFYASRLNRGLLTISGILLIAFVACKRTVKSARSPFRIQNTSLDALNQIRHVVALEDNTFLVSRESFNHDETQVYHFSSDLQLLDSITVPGALLTKPVPDGPNSFIVIAEYTKNGGGTTVFRLSNNLKILNTRYIETAFYLQTGEDRYQSKVTRLRNGDFVVANPYSNPSTKYDRSIAYCVHDFFTDVKPKWRMIPPANAERKWVEGMYPAADSGFYLVYRDNTGLDQLSGMDKYDQKGKAGFSVKVAESFYGALLPLFVDADKLVLNNLQDQFMYDLQGNYLGQETLNNGGIAPSSTLVRSGNHYFYVCDFQNSDGRFAEIRKTDLNLKVLQSTRIGNRGTNSQNYTIRHLVKLTNGDMVAVIMIENPNSTGNHWMLYKFDENLQQKE